MARIAFGALALAPVVLVPSAPAQGDATSILRPVSSAVRDGGTLHLPDGTWTRRSGTAPLGADVLYDNTCAPQYFGTLDGDTYVDEGRIPGPTSPNNATSRQGCATSYAVEGFQVGYCTDQTSASFTYAFYDNYTACSTTIGVTPLATFALTGLPGAPGSASLCWTVNVDTSAMPFSIGAGATNPLFGIAISSPQPGAAHGPLIAGAPNTCSNFDGTSWDPTPNLAENGTGMGTQDLFRIEGGSTTPGCYFFGGNPFGSFWLEIYGDSCAPDATGQSPFCVPGTFAVVACPCANNPAPNVVSGCRNSLGTGATLTGSGTPSLSSDSVVLGGFGMPPSSSVLYFQGDLRFNAGIGQVFGDGLRCAGGNLVRLGTSLNSAGGTSQYPGVGQQAISVRGGITQPGARTYQAWYRNVAAFCTTAAFNTSNGWEIYWGV